MTGLRRALTRSKRPTYHGCIYTIRLPNRRDFSTQVTVFNVGMHATQVQFEKILKANDVEYKRAKKTPAVSHGVLAFEVQR